ncbi:RecQ family ATP-dependent DNA helicase [Texcoconibacillus texcoconensis]|uniref:ATP-dependent DNA helicase RecQ n=1 Tax=Texcoconibacillus texcoconensis TaxID=1095777 RepID=A0A840QNL6_9BACI|nr:ATP-dependent DNA helicase RecQ [Texcoconibacillus texcoconensis]MBB5172931.1 ATP-dependent DNA helicase RecQ [Texcoconibacillus texcoconensis]
METFLKQKFGFSNFRPGQREIIADVLSRKNVLAVLPTGSGKTLCYQLPSHVFKGITVVVSPLLSLMDDQVQQMRSQGDKGVIAINSYLSNDEKRNILRTLPQYRMIFVSPEMLQLSNVLEALQRVTVSLFVVDEAHCISQWGHEFRTDYLRLGDIRKALHYPPCLALTATATKDIQQDIIEQLGLHEVHRHIYSVDRENIAYIQKHFHSHADKLEYLTRHLSEFPAPGIIYTSSRQLAEHIVYEAAKNQSYKIAYYHAGMLQEDRRLIQHQFLEGSLDFVVATNAFGMGVHKSDIRSVIHVQLPTRMEAYVQEVGRAGRDGKQSYAFLLHADGDDILPLQLIQREYPDQGIIDSVFATMKQQVVVTRSDLEQRCYEMGLEETQQKLLLFYLEKSHIIQNGRVDNVNPELLQQVKNELRQRETYRFQLFRQFEESLLSHKCLRAQILSYFEENLTKRLDPCCSRCGDIVIEREVYDKQNKKNRSKTWNQRLKAMLALGEEEEG